MHTCVLTGIHSRWVNGLHAGLRLPRLLALDWKNEYHLDFQARLVVKSGQESSLWSVQISVARPRCPTLRECSPCRAWKRHGRRRGLVNRPNLSDRPAGRPAVHAHTHTLCSKSTLVCQTDLALKCEKERERAAEKRLTMH